MGTEPIDLGVPRRPRVARPPRQAEPLPPQARDEAFASVTDDELGRPQQTALPEDLTDGLRDQLQALERHRSDLARLLDAIS